MTTLFLSFNFIIFPKSLLFKAYAKLYAEFSTVIGEHGYSTLQENQ